MCSDSIFTARDAGFGSDFGSSASLEESSLHPVVELGVMGSLFSGGGLDLSGGLSRSTPSSCSTSFSVRDDVRDDLEIAALSIIGEWTSVKGRRTGWSFNSSEGVKDTAGSCGKSSTFGWSSSLNEGSSRSAANTCSSGSGGGLW